MKGLKKSHEKESGLIMVDTSGRLIKTLRTPSNHQITSDREISLHMEVPFHVLSNDGDMVFM